MLTENAQKQTLNKIFYLFYLLVYKFTSNFDKFTQSSTKSYIVSNIYITSTGSQNGHCEVKPQYHANFQTTYLLKIIYGKM